MIKSLTLVLALAAVPTPAAAEWKLLWSDEFNAAKGTAPDGSKWTYDLGATGWGNKELQEYTNDRTNSFHDGNGHLVIRALRVADGKYTSARLKTQGKFDFTYGKVAARIKVPFGQGIWPAFWMLGNNIETVDWPECGEIDVMEIIGREPGTVHGTVHGPGYSGGDSISRQLVLPNDQRLADDFHVFAAEWSPDAIQFFLDDQPYGKVSRTDLPSGSRWVFDHPFFLIMNLAVGGLWPGYPDATTTFPQTMTIDWVRVWQRADPAR